MASKLVLALRERGHDIIVVTRRDQPDLPALEQFCGINVYRFPFWTVLNNGGMKGLLELRQQIIRIKREFRPDLVHMNCFGPSWLFYQDTARHDAAPLLVTLHTMPQHTMVKRALEPDGLLRRTLNTADWVTCVSAAVLDHTRARVAEITGRSSVVYNGLEDPGVFPAPLPLDPPRILCVGRLVREKGFDLALSAFALLLKAFPKARLIIAGDGTSRHELECQAGDLGLTHAVEFIGWVVP